MHSATPIELLEALYDLERPRDAWFGAVLATAGALLDRGSGVGMLLYDVSGSVPRVDALDGFNVPAANKEIGKTAHAESGWAAGIVECYRNVVCGTLDEHVPDPEVRRSMRERYATVGLCDQLLINGANASGLGLAFFVFSSTRLRLRATERAVLTRLATHLSTAYRLHRRLALVPAEMVDGVADAVLSVDGALQHAEPAARSAASRESLKDAVRSREWARSRAGRRDPDRATSAWQPLVTGRWSLVDRFERDGRRYITARENTPARAGLELLTPRERQVASLADLGRSNKVIAYELGLGHSTVRVLLARAAFKLGARTRTELINRVRLLQQAASSGPSQL